MVTTIQISEELQGLLMKRKCYERQTYEEVIYDLLEDAMEISEETKRDLAMARAEVATGKTKTLAEIKRELKL